MEVFKESFLWPGERDSNPWRCYPQRFSRPPLSTTQPSPDKFCLLEATSGFEPEIKALQAHALPLGYVALIILKKWCPRPDLNRHGRKIPRDFKSLVSTISTTWASQHGSHKDTMLYVFLQLMY